ncbi:CLUMA_CG006961, isoform A [Clunio marinus]|uniref:CLUMA_CG006961, isoform A n=1 Tax=Clunio marinus TaxID=568069 RepID=A0A1J1I4X0_9DIPT|nr:CLUMA_CG006961, isoform A [Clunio marinus]
MKTNLYIGSFLGLSNAVIEAKLSDAHKLVMLILWCDEVLRRKFNKLIVISHQTKKKFKTFPHKIVSSLNSSLHSLYEPKGEKVILKDIFQCDNTTEKSIREKKTSCKSLGENEKSYPTPAQEIERKEIFRLDRQQTLPSIQRISCKNSLLILLTPPQYFLQMSA